jgi:hypothetical protein
VRKFELKVSKESESVIETAEIEAPKKIRCSKRKKQSVVSKEELFIEDQSAGNTEPSAILLDVHKNIEYCVPSTSEYNVSKFDDEVYSLFCRWIH